MLYSGAGNGYDSFLTNGTGTAVAQATTAGTTIGVNGYANGVEQILGLGDTKILDSNSSRTLDFSTTQLADIAEVNAAGGNDVITTSNLSAGTYRGGSGNDKFHTGDQDVALLYSGTRNGYDSFLTNGMGTTVAQATTAGTTIGVNGYANGVEQILGLGDTRILDSNSSHTLDFSNTLLNGIAEVNAAGGNDVVTTSNLSAGTYRGGSGNDKFHTGDQDVTLLYSGTGNGYDSFLTNGIGTAVARATTAGTTIGVNGYANGVEQIVGLGDTKILDSNSSHTLDFSDTLLIGIAEVNAAGGNDVVTTSNLSAGTYRGGSGNDKFHTGEQDVTFTLFGD